MYMNLNEFLGGIVHWLLVDILGGLVGWIGLHGLADWLGRWWLQNLITDLLVVLIIFVVGLLASITLIWEERKLLGRFMDRRGTQVGPLGLFQNVADGIKVLLKEHIVPLSADKLVYEIAPILLIGTSAFLMVTVPYSPGFLATNTPMTVILTFAIFSVAPFAVLIGGWASNNKYTLIGGMRAAAQIISYEIPLLLSVVSVVIMAGSLSLVGVVSMQVYHEIWYIVPLFIGAAVFLICMIAELERVPFDLPEAEAELVEGWGTEYGDMRFGLIMAAEYMRSFVGSALFVVLFLGGWSGPLDLIPDEIWFILKVFLVFAFIVWIRAALPRVRTDQILNIGWKRLLPLAVANIFIALIFKSLGWFC